MLLEAKAIFTYFFPQITASKLISKSFTCFPVKIVEIIAAFLSVNRKFGKVGLLQACETREILFHRTAFLEFWKSSESWLVGVINKPLIERGDYNNVCDTCTDIYYVYIMDPVGLLIQEE